MPRNLADNTVTVYERLWDRPWAAASDIARVTNIKDEAIANVLLRGVEKGRLHRATLGRVRDAVNRYVFSKAGIEEMHERFGWEISWWHAAAGVEALAGRLELLEMSYFYLPQLWQSNMVTGPACHVYKDIVDVNPENGELLMRAQLVRRDWRRGRLAGFKWLQHGTFEAMASYDDGRNVDDLLHVPILWLGDFQKSADIDSLLQDMRGVLKEDERWLKLPRSQWSDDEYRPGAVVFAADRVAGAMAQRFWLDSLDRDNATTVAIVDTDGQVIRAMDPPTARWSVFRPPPPAPRRLGNIAQIVGGLETGAYAAVNGVQSWRIFQTVVRAPAVTIEHIVEFTKLPRSVVVGLLKTMTDTTMTDTSVITVWRNGHYVDEAGRDLLRRSQKKTQGTVDERLAIYTRVGGRYRSRHRIHNEKQADARVFLEKHGYLTFPALGIVIEYIYNGKRYRVDPDGFVLLEPGVMLALEFERNIDSPRQARIKVGGQSEEEKWHEDPGKYRGLVNFGRAVPVLFISETDEAAQILAELRCPFLLAANLDSVREGPHGEAVIMRNRDEGTPGCWWFWYPGEEGPTADAPIDLLAKWYARQYPNDVWRMPVDRPFRLNPT